MASLQSLPDPRVDRTKHQLRVDIMAIAICTVVCGGVASSPLGKGETEKGMAGVTGLATAIDSGKPDNNLGNGYNSISRSISR
jgi:hypothetical protein